MGTTNRVALGPETSVEVDQAKSMAARYRCEFVDLRVASIDHDLFRSIPVDLMFRYNFVPMHAENGTLEIALSDPRNLTLIDELTILLNKQLKVKVATLSQISELLKKTEQSQRVLEEVTEGFALDVVMEDGGGLGEGRRARKQQRGCSYTENQFHGKPIPSQSDSEPIFWCERLPAPCLARGGP